MRIRPKKDKEEIKKIKRSVSNRRPQRGSPRTYIQGVYDKLQVLKTLIVTTIKSKTLKAKTGIFGVNERMTLTDNEIDISSGDLTLDIAGNITLDADGGTVNINDSAPALLSPTLKMTSTDAGGTGAHLIFSHLSSSPAASDILGLITLAGKNSNGDDKSYVQIMGTITDPADNSEDGRLLINIISHDAATTALDLSGDSNGDANVTLGNGVGSLTTLKGDLDIDGSTITTAGNIELATGGSGNVTIDSAGDIALEAAGGDITMDAPLTITNTATPQIKLIDTAGEYAQMSVSGSGDLTIATVGSGTTDSDINLSADGSLNITLGTGTISAITSGFEASWGFNHGSKTWTIYGDVGDSLTFTCGADGASTIATTDGGGSVGTLTLDADGDIVMDCHTGKDISLTEATGTYTPTSANHAVPKHYVDEKVYRYVSIPKNEFKPSVLNSWYPLNYNHNMGTTVTNADFQDQDLIWSNIFQTSEAVKLKHINLSLYFTSSVSWEVALYDVTLPSDGAAGASTIAQIGSTMQVNGGSAVTMYRYYKLSVDLSDYALASEHGVYLIGRYTSGSGKKSMYVAGTLEVIGG
tara:strand:- start:8468 stop:10216 length:1749 start_codon:yes stop_codon:yes gene_type:complete